MVIWQAGEDEVGQGKSPSRVGASVCALAVFVSLWTSPGRKSTKMRLGGEVDQCLH